MKLTRIRLTLVTAIAATALTATAFATHAQPAAPPAPPAAPPAPQVIKQLKPGVFMITGGGGNTTVRVTGDSVILVDVKNNGQAFYDDLMGRIRSVTDKPVRYVFNTHHHGDHTGNNQRFIDAGAQVIASDEMKMIVMTFTLAPNAIRPAAPTVTFAKDYTVRAPGAEARAHHDAGGHTGGDAVVYFPDVKVVSVGDQLVAATPNIDSVNGGSFLGWQRNLSEVLKLDFDVAIPGHGDDPMSRAQVQAFKAKVDTFVERARTLVRGGTPKEQFLATIKTDDLGWNVNTPVWQNPMRLDRLYAEFAR